MKVYKKEVTAAQAVVECLTNAEIEHVFCVPGESYLPVLDALYETPKLNVVTNRHEGGAAFMAEGYAKKSRKPGVVLATRGVGAANLAIGVHTAFQDSTPMIVLLGQVHSKFRGREGFQEVDLDRFFQPIAKWATEIKDAERMPEIMERALRIAQTGRPGPVVISLPEDVLPKGAVMQFHAPISMPRPAPARSEIEQVGVMLQNARKPVVIAGGGIKAAGAEDVLQQFSEKYALPVAIAFRRHDVFPNDHPNYIGHLGLGAPEELRDTVAVADVVLVLGSRLSEVTTQDYSLLQPNQKLIHVDIHEESLGKVYPPTVGIVADCKEAITALLDLPVEVCFQEWTKKAHAQYVAATNVDAKVINHHIIHCMQEMLPHDAVITNDAGNFASWLHRYYPFTQKDTYIGPTSGAMGYGLPAAIGAKLADPDRVVVSLSGDGGLMMTVQELETAVRHQVATIHIVFNNDMYGTIRMHQEMHYPGRVVGTDLGAVSFTKLAESLGANGIKVETADEFKHALGVALQNTTATLIEVITDQEQISAGKTITALRKKI